MQTEKTQENIRRLCIRKEKNKEEPAPSIKVHTAPAQKLLVRQELPDAKEENGKPTPEFGFAEFWSFCAFAEKNAVFLTNQGCKGGKSGNRQTIAKSIAFCSFVPLQRKTQCLWQNLIAKVLWHKKSPNLPNAVSQSPEKKCRFHWRKNIPRRKPAYCPRILLCRILELLCLCREKRSVFGKTWLQRCFGT